MQGHRPYQLYFRHPETHTGDTNAKKQAIEEFLAARGYVIAPHTIDSEDFIFNVAYFRVVLQFATDASHRWKPSMIESDDPAHAHFSCFVLGSMRLMKKWSPDPEMKQFMSRS